MQTISRTDRPGSSEHHIVYKTPFPNISAFLLSISNASYIYLFFYSPLQLTTTNTNVTETNSTCQLKNKLRCYNRHTEKTSLVIQKIIEGDSEWWNENRNRWPFLFQSFVFKNCVTVNILSKNILKPPDRAVAWAV